MIRYDKRYFEASLVSLEGISPDDFIALLSPKAERILTTASLKTLLESGKKLKIKFGIDPTGSEIHLGHLVPIMILKLFIRAGHRVDFVIGDFTARIGDPAGRDSARAPLSQEDIKAHQSTYIDQISPFIEVKKLTISHNSKWLSSMTLDKLFPVLQSISLNDAVQREDFRARFKNDQAVSLAESTYGVLMGLDSVALETDIEIGGIDQLLNFQQCKMVQSHFEMKEETVITTPILVGTSGDGRKMSKSFQNYIAATASISEKFGKIMSIPDDLILSYFTSFADVTSNEISELKSAIIEDPFEMKKQFATLLVALETGSLSKGEEERETFEKKFSKAEIKTEDTVLIPSVSPGATFFDTLFSSGKFESKAELRRLFEQQAVRRVKDDSKVSLADVVQNDDGIIKVGKLKFFSFEILP